jgi:C1A family cysteine protease
MSHRIIFLIITLWSFQLYGQGLIFDQEAFDTGEQFEAERATFIPESFSLKKYAPYVFAQKLSTCVAYSTASALTMLHAINSNQTSQDVISLEAMSPHWIYYRNKDKTDKQCMEGLNIDRTMTDVLNYGVPYMLRVEYPDYFPYGEVQLCNYYPPDYEKDAANAVLNRPDEILRVKNINDIKLAISSGLPVVLGMMVPESFENASGKALWTPKISESKLDGYGHALVAVGYDDKKHGGAIEILNSWGENWGNKGYIWIKYSDFNKFFLGGYALFKEKKLKAQGPREIGVAGDNLLENDIKLSKNAKGKNGKNRYMEMIKKK